MAARAHELGTIRVSRNRDFQYQCHIMSILERRSALPLFPKDIYVLSNEVSTLRTVMDIDDILAETGNQAAAQEISDLQALVRAWVAERSAPEILPWPVSLMERVLQRINHQVKSERNCFHDMTFLLIQSIWNRLEWLSYRLAIRTLKPTSALS